MYNVLHGGITHISKNNCRATFSNNRLTIPRSVSDVFALSGAAIVNDTPGSSTKAMPSISLHRYEGHRNPCFPCQIIQVNANREPDPSSQCRFQGNACPSLINNVNFTESSIVRGHAFDQSDPKGFRRVISKVNVCYQNALLRSPRAR